MKGIITLSIFIGGILTELCLYMLTLEPQFLFGTALFFNLG